MAIDRAELEKAIVANLKLGGRDETAAKAMAGHAVRLSAKMVWRGFLWFFSTKSSDLTLTADDTDGFLLPDDCQTVLGVRRLTSDDYGWKLVGLDESHFDQAYPYPAAHDSNPVSQFKLGYDTDTQRLRLTVFPKSDDSDAAIVLYRFKFDAARVMTHFPDDFEPLLMVGAMYHATPAIDAQQVNVRGALLREFKELLNDYKKREAVMVQKMVDGGQLPRSPWAVGSWQYIVGGGPYGNPYVV